MKQFKKVTLSLTLAFALVGGTTVHADSLKSVTPIPTQPVQEASFTDVTTKHWAYEAVEWGVSEKITSGYPDGTFKPSKTVTEEQFLAMLIRAYQGESIDNGPGSWSEPYYEIAKQNNYITSKNPSKAVDRTFVAELIAGTQGVNYVGKDAIQYLLAVGLANGKTSATIAGYKGQDTLNRAEAIQFIKNVMDNADSKELQVKPKTPTEPVPDLPIPDGNQIGRKNAKLNELAQGVNNAVSEYGMTGGYNGDRGGVFIRDGDEYIIMAYTDGTAKKNGTVVINLGHMLKSDFSVNSEKLNASLAALNALGIEADAKLETAIREALSAKQTLSTVKYDGYNLEVMGIGAGQVLIYMD